VPDPAGQPDPEHHPPFERDLAAALIRGSRERGPKTRLMICLTDPNTT